MVAIVLLTTTCIAISFIYLVARTIKVRLVELDNIWQQIVWTVRIHRLGNTFPRTLTDWSFFDKDNPPHYFKRGQDAWETLRPYFASRGYTLYHKMTTSDELAPATIPAPAPPSMLRYPYARALDTPSNYSFILKNSCVWGARDQLGREVAIKLVSDTDNPTNEWLILQRLNSAELRLDPLNQTIHVLEFIKFDRLIFAVMPRWDCAFAPPFQTVLELMEITKSFLLAVEFLHRNNISHSDIRAGNCGMNLCAGFGASIAATGVRKPSDVKYVLYDFGYSLMYPAETDITTVSVNRSIGYQHAPSPPGYYNPFKADITMMGGLLFGFLMHAAKVVPDVDPFLYRMMDLDEDKRPSASEAVEQFMHIYDTLSVEQLQTPVDSRWDNQKSTKLLPSLMERWTARYGPVPS